MRENRTSHFALHPNQNPSSCHTLDTSIYLLTDQSLNTIPQCCMHFNLSWLYSKQFHTKHTIRYLYVCCQINNREFRITHSIRLLRSHQPPFPLPIRSRRPRVAHPAPRLNEQIMAKYLQFGLDIRCSVGSRGAERIRGKSNAEVLFIFHRIETNDGEHVGTEAIGCVMVCIYKYIYLWK